MSMYSGGGMFRADPPRTPVESGTARQAARDVQQLEERVERLSLVCMAMWSLLQDKTGLTEQDLMQRVEVLDLMDGTKDGKATTGIKKCSSCSRTLNPRHRKCLYCGQELSASSAFDAI